MHILETVNDCCLQRYSVNRPKRTNLCASFFFLFARFSKSSVFQQNLHIVRICFALWRYLYKSELQQLWRRQRKRENNKSSRVNKQNKSSQRTADGLADFWAVIAGLINAVKLDRNGHAIVAFTSNIAVSSEAVVATSISSGLPIQKTIVCFCVV